MAFMSCLGYCIKCHKLFNFNPELVPSIRVNGIREPVCKSCMDAANVQRIAAGMPPLSIMPGAYDPQEVA